MVAREIISHFFSGLIIH